MRVIVTGGGSGGHIYPAIAIADKFKEKDKDAEILYIGNHIGIEEELVPQTGYPFKMVDARWFEKKPIEILKTGIVTLKGKRQALRIMKDFKPDVVVGTGGYACTPVIMAGKAYGAKCYLHEQNAYPGVANRFLEKYVDNVFLGFEPAAKYFKEKDKLVLTGNPVRRRFYNVGREACKEKLNIPKDRFTIFVFAGSQGSNKISEVMIELISKINGKEEVQLLFATGPLHYENVLKQIESLGITLSDNIRIESYINNIENYIGAADLVISRAGALSLAEICICGRASVLIPSPNVTGNHQYHNARAVTDKGGGVLLEEKDLNCERLLHVMESLKADPSFRVEMEQNAISAAPSDATDIIYNKIVSSFGK